MENHSVWLDDSLDLSSALQSCIDAVHGVLNPSRESKVTGATNYACFSAFSNLERERLKSLEVLERRIARQEMVQRDGHVSFNLGQKLDMLDLLKDVGIACNESGEPLISAIEDDDQGVNLGIEIDASVFGSALRNGRVVSKDDCSAFPVGRSHRRGRSGKAWFDNGLSGTRESVGPDPVSDFLELTS